MDVVKGESALEPAVDGGRLPSPHPNEDAMGNIPLPVTDPNWQWPIFDLFIKNSGGEDLKERKPIHAEELWKSSPFRLLYRRQRRQVWHEEIKITLSSRPLVKILQEYLPDNGDLKSMDEPRIDGYELFIVLDSLKNHKAGSHSRAEDALKNNLPLVEAGEFKSQVIDNGNASVERPPVLSAESNMKAGELHLKHLVRCLEKEYKDTWVRARRMREEMRTAFDMLWAFLPPGSKVVYHCDLSQELLCGVVSASSYNYGKLDSLSYDGWYIKIDLEVWDYNGVRYGKGKLKRFIEQYKGEKLFTDLPVCPLELIGPLERTRLEETFLANGRKFHDLAVKDKNRYMHYTGPMFRRVPEVDNKSLSKQTADGRVMIDLASFAKMNPDYKLGNAQPPRGSSQQSSWTYSGTSTRANELVPLLSAAAEVSEENIIFAPAIVYGFSFALKEWGSFAVTGFQEICFDGNAFNELMMEAETKELVYRVVSQYVATPGDSKKWARVDPIARKGEGCVLLCYGPPGSGKTLTAESLAEKLEKPLWALSMSELGKTTQGIEKTLTKILEIVSTWQALLLLDEAETYLEERESGNLTRQMMAGVFLRVLDYYPGVLFLTTNRISTFDRAFRSRISMFLHYKQMGATDRAKVWETLLKRGEVEGATVEFCKEVGMQELNGREIRNVIHLAQVYASSFDEPVAARHVNFVLKKSVASTVELLNELAEAEDQIPSDIPPGYKVTIVRDDRENFVHPKGREGASIPSKFQIWN